ncbi:MAG: hypothetical protein E7463_03095 [Ruminococcaceae bacterium]|nr:hypothetical protein [Oscillospiraceae bacterium]
MIGQFRVYDAHAHIFPGKIAARAVESIAEFYTLDMAFDGLPHQLDEINRAAGIDGTLVFSAATVPHQVRTINDFIAAKCEKYPHFIGMGCLHPKMDGIPQEIERIRALGLHGIKFHPDFQNFDIDDPAFLPMYREIAANRLPVMFHMGDKRYDHSRPWRLANLLEKVPDLIAIAAHYGGYSHWEEVRRCLKGSSAWYDTSSSLAFMPAEYFRELGYELGIDRLLFGTDYPMWNVHDELKRFEMLGLPDEDKAKVLGGNFERLFGIG